MFLSRLSLNPRCREVRRDLADPYQMHRTLLRAFPDEADGGTGRVLFRADASRASGLLTVLVQSALTPAWDRLTVPREYLCEPAQYKVFEPSFAGGQVCQFRLRANPTVKRDGKRLGLFREDDQVRWLRRKGSEGGFEVLAADVVPEGMARGEKQCAEVRMELRLFGVRYDGKLRVSAPERFRTSLEAGIGSGKGFGFGLLSVAPA